MASGAVPSDHERSELMDSAPEHAQAPSIAPDGGEGVIEYVVRPESDGWRIDHAGDSYGPYRSCREATFFAIDAARKLGAAGKPTRVRAVDEAGHLLTTWRSGARESVC